MVCNRCVKVVKETIDDLGYKADKIALGEISFAKAVVPVDTVVLGKKLAGYGFSLLEDKKTKTVNEIKALVAEVYGGSYDFPENFRFSTAAKDRFHKDYETIRDIFIAQERITVEQYIIRFRINKVKEMLVYSSCSLFEIAFNLNFTSVAHLSSQFKQQTGLTPSFFKKIRNQKTDVIFSAN